MRAAWPLALLVLLAGCKVGPDYRRPAAIGTAGPFKEAPPPPSGWTVAHPGDALPKGAWWTIYNDPVLDEMERRVEVNNQNVRMYEAQYREAAATVDIARSALFPTLSGSVEVQRTSRGSNSSSFGATGLGVGTTTLAGSGGISTTTSSNGATGLGGASATGTSSTGTSTGGSRTFTTYSVTGNANWDLDVWGRIRRQVESDVAAAQVSAADLSNATLSAQALLATDYFELRAQDALEKLLTDTVAAYSDTLRIVQNQYNAGTVAGSDVAQAVTQLETARAQLVNVGVARAQYEHAIAVLTGVPPAELTLSPGTLMHDVPAPAAGLPSTLLQRRPDIAAAERTMQEQNALIGVQVAAYYPDVSLSALYGYSGNPLTSLIQAANRVWSLGAAATETFFEGGLRNAEVAAARDAYDASVASYRQTVLTALQQVEDELAALRILERQSTALNLAVGAAQRSVTIALNEYRAGTTAYTTVVTQQTALLGNQQTQLAVQEQRLVASVALVQALGGGYDARTDLPGADKLDTGLPFLKY